MTSVNFAQLLQEYGAGTEVVPDGPYDVQVAGAKVSASRTNPPKFMIVARLRIITGPYANKVLMHNFVLTPDNPNAMYHWFRNFSILGIGSEYFNTTAPMDQVLNQVAAALEGRQARVEAETTGSRQNVNFMAAAQGVGGVPMPPTPQPAPGMQPQFGTPTFQQPGPPVVPQPQGPWAGQPQPQPSVAPPTQPGPMAQPPMAPAAQQAPGMPPQGVGGFPAPPNGPAPAGYPGAAGVGAPPPAPAAPQGPPGTPLNVPGTPGYPQPPQAAPQPAPAPAPAPPGPGFPAPPAQPAAPVGPGVQPGAAQAPAPQQYPAPPAGAPEQQQAPQGFPVPASPPPQVPV